MPTLITGIENYSVYYLIDHYFSVCPINIRYYIILCREIKQTASVIIVLLLRAVPKHFSARVPIVPRGLPCLHRTLRRNVILYIKILKFLSSGADSRLVGWCVRHPRLAARVCFVRRSFFAHVQIMRTIIFAFPNPGVSTTYGYDLGNKLYGIEYGFCGASEKMIDFERERNEAGSDQATSKKQEKKCVEFFFNKLFCRGAAASARWGLASFS